ncbi:MAG: LamG domain-containing protein [Bacteroidota bacterium]
MMTKPMCGAYPDPLHCNSMGIVGRWLFNERGSRVVDVCRNFDAGAISGASWTGSKMGGGLRFDGSDDYVNIGTRGERYIDYNKPFTISAWLTFHTYASTSYHAVLGHVSQRGTTYSDIEIRINPNDQWEFVFTQAPATNTQDGFHWIWAATVPVVGALYNLVFTYDGLNNYNNSVKFYLNGISQGASSGGNFGAITQSMYQSGFLQSHPLWVGRRNFGGGDMPFPGIIDQVIISNRVWIPDEVKSIYKNPWSGLICSTYEMEELERA